MPQKKTCQRPDTSAKAPTSETSRRTRDVKLLIPPGEPDSGSLVAVAREWLLPILVQQFLQERGIETTPQSRNSAAFTKVVYGTPLQGARDKSRGTS